MSDCEISSLILVGLCDGRLLNHSVTTGRKKWDFVRLLSQADFGHPSTKIGVCNLWPLFWIFNQRFHPSCLTIIFFHLRQSKILQFIRALTDTELWSKCLNICIAWDFNAMNVSSPPLSCHLLKHKRCYQFNWLYLFVIFPFSFISPIVLFDVSYYTFIRISYSWSLFRLADFLLIILLWWTDAFNYLLCFYLCWLCVLTFSLLKWITLLCVYLNVNAVK